MATVMWASLAVLCGGVVAAAERSPEAEILAMERGVMEGWLKGDPAPMLATLAPDVTYFHFPVEKRLEGIEAVKAMCEPYRGRALFDRYEIVDPKVRVTGEVAVLTYQLSFTAGTTSSVWNATQVYRRTKEGWRVTHAHWSQARTPQR